MRTPFVRTVAGLLLLALFGALGGKVAAAEPVKIPAAVEVQTTTEASTAGEAAPCLGNSLWSCDVQALPTGTVDLPGTAARTVSLHTSVAAWAQRRPESDGEPPRD